MGSRIREIGHLAGKINIILIDHDLEGLIKMGAPDDEYENEAWLIEQSFSYFDEEDFTLSNVARVIVTVWNKQFGKRCPPRIDGLTPMRRNEICIVAFKILLVIKDG